MTCFSSLQRAKRIWCLQKLNDSLLRQGLHTVRVLADGSPLGSTSWKQSTHRSKGVIFGWHGRGMPSQDRLADLGIPASVASPVVCTTQPPGSLVPSAELLSPDPQGLSEMKSNSLAFQVRQRGCLSGYRLTAWGLAPAQDPQQTTQKHLTGALRKADSPGRAWSRNPGTRSTHCLACLPTACILP